MKALLIFTITALSVISAKADVIKKSISVDGTKPLYVLLETKGIGPGLQCYFGSDSAGKRFLLGPLMSYEPLSEENDFEFSQTSAVLPSEVQKMNGKSFGSRMVCWILNETVNPGSVRKVSASIMLYQDAKNILFSDSFTEMTRVGESALWTTSVDVLKAGEIVVK